MDAVEEPDAEPGGGVGSEGAHRVLEGVGVAVVVDAEHFPVEHQVGVGERAQQGDDVGESVGDIVEVSREEADRVAGSMGLDARPVELPFDRCRSGGRERVGDVSGRGRQHRLDRATHGEAGGVERCGAAGQRQRGCAAEVAGEHGGAPDDLGRDAEGDGDGVGHQSGESALSELAGEDPTDEVGLGFGQVGRQIGQETRPRRLRARAGGGQDGAEGVVEAGDVDARLARAARELAGGGPADADAAVAGRSGEEADGRLDLVGR